jgi:hypothetical protein
VTPSCFDYSNYDFFDPIKDRGIEAWDALDSMDI